MQSCNLVLTRPLGRFPGVASRTCLASRFGEIPVSWTFHRSWNYSSEEYRGIQDFTILCFLSQSITPFNLQNYAVFESSRFVTGEQRISRRTAFNLLICISFSQLRVPSRVHTTVKHLNVSTYCSILLFIFSKQCLGFPERRDTLVSSVLFFILGW